MTRRLTLVFSLALASITASCLRPIDPNAPRPVKEVAQPAEPTAQPTEPVPPPTQPAAQPTQPAAQPAQPDTQATRPIAQPVAEPVAPVQQPVQPVTQPTPPAVQPAAPAPSLPTPVMPKNISDANIAAMVLASNNTDISYARLVPARAQREDILRFAERMLTDHTGVNALVADLLRKLNLSPQDNVLSLDMRDESANRRDILRELSGFAFDSAYIENEVAYHQRFLASIDNVMMPHARNADLRTLLVSVRPAVAAHLAHAEQTRANVLAKK